MRLFALLVAGCMWERAASGTWGPLVASHVVLQLPQIFSEQRTQTIRNWRAPCPLEPNPNSGPGRRRQGVTSFSGDLFKPISATPASGPWPYPADGWWGSRGVGTGLALPCSRLPSRVLLRVCAHIPESGYFILNLF